MTKGSESENEAQNSGQIQRNKSQEKTLKNKIRKLEKEVKTQKNENEELKNKYLRIAAEIENLRKRLEREKNEYLQYALSEFLKELLVVLDNFERALESENQEDEKSFREGMELIQRQYLDLLIKQGVKPVETKDKKFDPNIHQAFMTEESDKVDEPEVGEEFQKGYCLHDRLLRPALVKVVVPKKDK